MENVITKEYFRGVIELPFLQYQSEYGTPSGDVASDKQNEIDLLITEFQSDFLIRLFGSEVIPDCVKSLVYNENTLRSPIADYVFCNAIHEYQSQATISGEKNHSAQNSISVSYVEKYLYIWNKMVKSCLKIRKVLYDNGLHDTYPTDINDEFYIYKSFV